MEKLESETDEQFEQRVMSVLMQVPIKDAKAHAEASKAWMKIHENDGPPS